MSAASRKVVVRFKSSPEVFRNLTNSGVKTENENLPLFVGDFKSTVQGTAYL
jgi:hypothetical protein